MARASISFVKGRGSMNHNNRVFITKNVDQRRTKDNIIYVQESLEIAYKKCFGKAIEDYNERQKRADRRIDGAMGYMGHIRNSKNGEKVFYENVVQVGNMFDSQVGTEQGDICKKILDDYMNDFQQKNPNLYVFNAVMHLDEQTPHLHIDYIPIAHGYKQGLAVRNSLDRALKEQGIDGKTCKYENSTIAWQNREKKRIEGIMKSYGIGRVPDKELKQKHLNTDQYKAVALLVHNEVREMPKQIETSPFALNKTRVSVDKEDLKKLEKRAKLSLEHEKACVTATRDLKAEISALKEKEKEYDYAILCAEDERERALKAQELYLFQFNQQKELNDEYDRLKKDYEGQRQTIISLREENNLLKDRIKETEKDCAERVEKLSSLYKEKINGLEQKLSRAHDKIVDVVMAFNMLKYDEKDGYRIDRLSDRQSRLFDAVEGYTKKYLKDVGEESKAKEIENSIGVIDGIRRIMEELMRKADKRREYDRER